MSIAEATNRPKNGSASTFRVKLEQLSEAPALVAPGRPMLEYLPVGLFGSVMGLTGLSIAWQLAHEDYGCPPGSP